MALIFNEPLTTTIGSFVGAQADGVLVDPRGTTAPIPGFIEIGTAPEGSPALMSRITPEEEISAGAIRSEINYSAEANAERWYVWEMFHPTVPTDVLVFMQVHDTPDGGESPVKHPNFTFTIEGGMAVARVPLNAPNEGSSSGRMPVQKATPFITGRWVQCALHTNWGVNASGFLEVFYDNQLLCREWNRASGYNDAVGPYWKMGLYCIDGDLSQSYEAWYRNARLYSTGHSAQSVLGVLPRLTDLTQMVRAA
jgi:hypothetical protein